MKRIHTKQLYYTKQVFKVNKNNKYMQVRTAFCIYTLICPFLYKSFHNLFYNEIERPAEAANHSKNGLNGL